MAMTANDPKRTLVSDIQLANRYKMSVVDVRAVLDRLIREDKLYESRDPTGMIIVTEADTEMIKRAIVENSVQHFTTARPGDPDYPLHNDGENLTEERVAARLNIPVSRIHQLLHQMADINVIRDRREDKRSNSPEKYIVNEREISKIEGELAAMSAPSPQKGTPPMTQTAPSNTQATSSDPWAKPSGRTISQKEVEQFCSWSSSNVDNLIMGKRWLPNRGRNKQGEWWFFASDLWHYFVTENHMLRNGRTPQDIRRWLEAPATNGSASRPTAAPVVPIAQAAPKPAAPVSSPASELVPRSPAPAPVAAPVASAQKSEPPAPAPAPDPLLKVDPRGRVNAQVIERMNRYLFTEVGVLDMPDVKKVEVKAELRLVFDNQDLAITLTPADLGITMPEHLPPIIMWTVQAPTVDSPETPEMFQVVLVNGAFHHINLEKATEPEHEEEEQAES